MSRKGTTITIRNYIELSQLKEKQCEKCEINFKIDDEAHITRPGTYYHKSCWEETLY